MDFTGIIGWRNPSYSIHFEYYIKNLEVLAKRLTFVCTDLPLILAL
jgi:hypothetical protein